MPQRAFAQTLGRTLSRQAIVPAPAFALKLAMGEMASMLLAGQRAVPAKLLAAGFDFRYPHLNDALTALLQEK